MNNLDVFRSQPRDTKIKIHGRDAFEGMARAGQLAARALDMLVPHVKPGATTERLDELVVEFASDHRAIPAPLNYRGFPKAICTSVMCGHDTDCNGATVGSIVGAAAGRRSFDDTLAARLHDTIKPSVIGFEEVSMRALAERTLVQFRRVDEYSRRRLSSSGTQPAARA